jgi:hypothetical protein
MCLVTAVLRVEPPIGVEPMTYALRGVRELSTGVQYVTANLLIRLPVPVPSMLIHARC